MGGEAVPGGEYKGVLVVFCFYVLGADYMGGIHGLVCKNLLSCILTVFLCVCLCVSLEIYLPTCLSFPLPKEFGSNAGF